MDGAEYLLYVYHANIQLLSARVICRHYLCTVAAGGHGKTVKPLRLGTRRNETIVVNRQLGVANAFEELIQERTPGLHRKIRGAYDRNGRYKDCFER